MRRLAFFLALLAIGFIAGLGGAWCEYHGLGAPLLFVLAFSAGLGVTWWRFARNGGGK